MYKIKQIMAAPVKTVACFYAPEERDKVYRQECNLYALCDDTECTMDGPEVKMMTFDDEWGFPDDISNFLGFEIRDEKRDWDSTIKFILSREALKNG